VTISLTISKTTKVTVPDIEELNYTILEDAVKTQIVLPYEIKYIKPIISDNLANKKIIEDLSNWVVDDFEVVEE
jgi:hypothetical protein